MKSKLAPWRLLAVDNRKHMKKSLKAKDMLRPLCSDVVGIEKDKKRPQLWWLDGASWRRTAMLVCH